MSVQTLNPAGLVPPEGYVHVTVAPAGWLIHVAGQTAVDADGRLIADDLCGQTAAAISNVSRALAAADATLADVVSGTILVVDFGPDALGELVDGAMRAAAAGDVLLTALTLIAVPALAVDDARVEIAVTAVRA